MIAVDVCGGQRYFFCAAFGNALSTDRGQHRSRIDRTHRDRDRFLIVGCRALDSAAVDHPHDYRGLTSVVGAGSQGESTGHRTVAAAAPAYRGPVRTAELVERQCLTAVGVGGGQRYIQGTAFVHSLIPDSRQHRVGGALDDAEILVRDRLTAGQGNRESAVGRDRRRPSILHYHFNSVGAVREVLQGVGTADSACFSRRFAGVQGTVFIDIDEDCPAIQFILADDGVGTIFVRVIVHLAGYVIVAHKRHIDRHVK